MMTMESFLWGINVNGVFTREEGFGFSLYPQSFRDASEYDVCHQNLSSIFPSGEIWLSSVSKTSRNGIGSGLVTLFKHPPKEGGENESWVTISATHIILIKPHG